MAKHGNSFEVWLCRQQGVLPQTALRYVLESLVPYTKANYQLAFRPNRFFNELEKISAGHYAYATIRQAYYEAKKKNYIRQNDDGALSLSAEAQNTLRPFKPKKLAGANVLVVFDIPEDERRKRRWIRLLLKELKFTQVQKSVWMSEFDCAAVLSAAILEKRLERYVRVYEARPVEAQ